MNSNFDQLSQAIEGFDFRFETNQAAGFDMFKRIVHDHEAFRSLREYAATKDGAQRVLDRIYELLSVEINPQYENPYDVSLAAYLFALRDTHVGKAITAANRILEAAQLWWARKLTEHILAENTQVSLSSSQAVLSEETLQVTETLFGEWVLVSQSTGSQSEDILVQLPNDVPEQILGDIQSVNTDVETLDLEFQTAPYPLVHKVAS